MKILEAYTEKDGKKLRLLIEEDTSVGFYLIVYPEGEAKSIADYLQDSLEEVFADAEERYGVSRNDWIKLG